MTPVLRDRSVDMEWSKAEIRQTERGVFEAELRGDHLISGDKGATEESARESLKAALADLGTEWVAP